MAGWLDTLFGNLPPPPSQPRRPASRGALLGAGYRDMPDMKAPIEDRRTSYDVPWPGQYFPGHDPNAILRESSPLGAKFYDQDQWSWLQSHAGGVAPPEQSAPLIMPQDSSYYADPSITARIKAYQDRQWREGQADWANPNLPQGPRNGPQFTPDQLINALQYWGGGQ